MNRGKIMMWVLGMLGVALIAIQAVPYGRAHTNPPTTGNPAWDSETTEELTRRACFDCHSNQTRWPWYSSFAPFSWLVQHHVDEGRSELNFTEFDKPQKEAHEAAEMVEEGKMPKKSYLLLHPEARLSDAERRVLALGFREMFGDERESEHSENDDE
jgi:hypothetical protein